MITPRLTQPTLAPVLGGLPSFRPVVERIRGDAQFDCHMQDGRDFWWHDLIAGANLECPCEPMDAEDPLFLLLNLSSNELDLLDDVLVINDALVFEFEV